MVKQHNQLIIVVMGLLDLVVTTGTWAGCFYLRFYSGWFSVVENTPPGLAYIADIVIVTLLLTLLLFGRLGMYGVRRGQSIRAEIVDIVRACAIVWIVLVAISLFLRSSPVSRKLLGMFLIAWPAALICYRGAVRMLLRFFRTRGRNLRTVAIVGTGRLAQKLLHVLTSQRWTGYQTLYFVGDTHIGDDLLGVPVHGPIENVDRILATEPVDVAFIALPKHHSDLLENVLNKLSTALVDLNVVPDLLSYHFLRHEVRQIGSLGVVNLTHSPQSGWNATMKRIFDVVLSLAAIIVLSPLMLLIAAAIKLTSPGKVFYVQRRASLGGGEFNIIKFRSMRPNTKTDGEQDEWSPSENNPRVTVVGRILRKLSLDELPQLFNVLTGDMSLVGPRPERPEFIKRFTGQIPRYVLRHHVKSGITGWAQVNGYRGRTSLHKRIQYDLDYINRWSFGFDLWILILTVFRGFVNRSK